MSTVFVNRQEKRRTTMLDAVGHRLARFRRAEGILGLVIVLALLANAVLLVGYLNAASQRSALARQAQDARHAADELATRAEGGEDVTTQPQPARVNVPQEINSADIMDLFLRMAQESAVEVVSVNDQGVKTTRVGDRDYRSFRFAVELRARASQLVAFLNRLEQSQYSPLFIDNMTATPTGNQSWTVAVNIVTYAAG